MREATDGEIEVWDKLIVANPDGGNVLQSRALAETKARFGWQPRYFVERLTLNDERSTKGLAVMVLTRRVLGLGEVWYVPKGPGVNSLEGLAEFTSKVERITSKAFVVKVESELLRGEVSEEQLCTLGLTKVRDLQFNVNTVIVDLKPTEDDILASFRQKTRYNVRLAEKHGVKVEAVECSQESVDRMYGLMEATRDRAGFYLRGKDYFETFWTEHARRGCGQFFLAKDEGQVLGGVFVTYLGGKALYKDGGSIREHSNLQAPYLLQWEVMKWLKAQGATEYDMHGTPPGSEIENNVHPLHSLGRFKTGFNPQVTEYVGTWDLVLDKAKYDKWQRFGERAAQVYAHRVKRQLFY